MRRRRFILPVLLCLGSLVSLTLAQRGGRGGRGGGGFGGAGGFGGGGFGGGGFGRGGGNANPDITPLPANRRGTPTWELDPHFKEDVFTFVRLKFTSGPYREPDQTSDRSGWKTDWPSADVDFSYRLQELTSLKVNPYPIQIEITDPSMFQHPLVTMEQVGRLKFTDEEVTVLRRYLLNGGFLLVGDHWGPYEYQNFHDEMKRLFPDREPVDLPLSHPIFHCVYDFKAKPQIPEAEIAERYRDQGVTWEREDSKEPFFRGIFDDKNRMMVLIVSNCDLTDGWEKEGTDEWFFQEFCVKKAYPMGINIIFYAMTH